VPLLWITFMAKNFRNGTNIIAKQYTIFLGEEILKFFTAPTVKKTSVSWGRRFQPLTWSEKCG